MDGMIERQTIEIEALYHQTEYYRAHYERVVLADQRDQYVPPPRVREVSFPRSGGCNRGTRRSSRSTGELSRRTHIEASTGSTLGST